MLSFLYIPSVKLYISIMKSKIKKLLEFNIVHVETVSVPRDTR